MTKARGLNDGKGYSFRYVYEILRGFRRNAQVTALHDEVVALRTPRKCSKR